MAITRDMIRCMRFLRTLETLVLKPYGFEFRKNDINGGMEPAFYTFPDYVFMQVYSVANSEVTAGHLLIYDSNSDDEIETKLIHLVRYMRALQAAGLIESFLFGMNDPIDFTPVKSRNSTVRRIRNKTTTK